MEPLNSDRIPTAVQNVGCDSWRQFHRRRFLNGAATLAGGLLSQGMLTRLAERLALAA